MSDDLEWDKRQSELPRLADRLGFANAMITQLRKELSDVRVQRGKDAAYITELEDKVRHQEQEIDRLKKLTPKEKVDLGMAKPGKRTVQNRSLKRQNADLIMRILRLKQDAKRT